jgi:DNA-binding NarL/FixJ family response regulator
VIRVLLADDHGLVREGIRHVLGESEGFLVVAEAARGDEVLPLAKEHGPDVVVLDITMPKQSGLQVAAALREEIPGVKILILSMHDHSQYVVEAVHAGADGYLLKDASPAELRKAVRAVHRGESFFSPSVARRLSDAMRDDGTTDPPSGSLQLLTARERDVLVLIAEGLTNKQIASELGISPRTVETHRVSLVRKLRIRSVAGLTRFAIENGLVSS